MSLDHTFKGKMEVMLNRKYDNPDVFHSRYIKTPQRCSICASIPASNTKRFGSDYDYPSGPFLYLEFF